MTLEQALALFAAPRQRRGQRAAASPLRELGADPVSGEVITLREGRFGPYVTDGTYNASLRRADDPTTITPERAAELHRREACGGSAGEEGRGGQEGAAAKKAAAKKAARQEGRREEGCHAKRTPAKAPTVTRPPPRGRSASTSSPWPAARTSRSRGAVGPAG